jgi:hypothetical protein
MKPQITLVLCLVAAGCGYFAAKIGQQDLLERELAFEKSSQRLWWATSYQGQLGLSLTSLLDIKRAKAAGDGPIRNVILEDLLESSCSQVRGLIRLLETHIDESNPNDSKRSLITEAKQTLATLKASGECSE